MRMDRKTLCVEICKLIRMSRHNPQSKHLSRKELLQVYSHLCTQHNRIEEQQKELQEISVDANDTFSM